MAVRSLCLFKLIKTLGFYCKFSSASIAKLGKGENITTGVLLKICKALDCDISDIMETIKDTLDEK